MKLVTKVNMTKTEINWHVPSLWFTEDALFGISELTTLTPLLLKNVQAKTNNGETVENQNWRKFYKITEITALYFSKMPRLQKRKAEGLLQIRGGKKKGHYMNAMHYSQLDVELVNAMLSHFSRVRLCATP